jgi:hypothetical protein
VADQPPRRPKANKRFVREVSGELWQIDATCVRLHTKAEAWVIDAIDDHSRLLLAAVAWDAPTADAASDCFETAASRYGLPRQVLSVQRPAQGHLRGQPRLPGKLIQVGRRWAGATVRIEEVGTLVHVYHGHTLVRVLAFDPDSYYQGLGSERRRGTTMGFR